VSDTTHPKAIEAEKRAAERAKRKSVAKLIVTQATQQGVHFLEILPNDYSKRRKGSHQPAPAQVGRMTIAYKVDRRNVVAVATTLCHSDDDFDKLEGRARAAVNMAEGHVILMRVPSPNVMPLKAFLTQSFRVNTYDTSI
jgi:hypothetical protein